MQNKRKTDSKPSKPAQTSWGGVAHWYDTYLGDQDNYQAQVIAPNLRRIIGPADAKKGAKLLDMGCGQGYFSFLASELGYKVTGADIAPELITLAKTRAKEHGAAIDFVVAPAADMKAVESGAYDAVLCVLALQNIKELDKAIAEAARALKPGGRFIFVLNHPGFRVPQHSDWQFDTQKMVQSRVVSKYLQESTIHIDMTPGELRPSRKHITLSFHRPLQVFVKFLSKNGLLIRKLEEWSSHKKTEAGPRKEAEDLARKEIPMFMCIEAVLGKKSDTI